MKSSSLRRLNLGCGEHLLPMKDSWDNIDIRPIVPPPGYRFLLHDVRRVRDLYEDGSIAEIYASDILEHMPKPHGIQFIEDCHALLAQGAKMLIRTPEFVRILTWGEHSKPKPDMETFRYRFFGWNDYPENSHCFVWLEKELMDVLKAHGLEVLDAKTTETTNITVVLRKK